MNPSLTQEIPTDTPPCASCCNGGQLVLRLAAIATGAPSAHPPDLCEHAVFPVEWSGKGHVDSAVGTQPARRRWP
eukprot:s578_g9.t1